VSASRPLSSAVRTKLTHSPCISPPSLPSSCAPSAPQRYAYHCYHEFKTLRTPAQWKALHTSITEWRADRSKPSPAPDHSPAPAAVLTLIADLAEQTLSVVVEEVAPDSAEGKAAFGGRGGGGDSLRFERVFTGFGKVRKAARRKDSGDVAPRLEDLTPFVALTVRGERCELRSTPDHHWTVPITEDVNGQKDKYD
jgi:hypothetical protein